MTSDKERQYLLGIDGGGTRTRAVLIDALGQTLAASQAGPSNFGDVGIEAAQANIGQAVRDCWRQAGLEQCPAHAAFLGMAGVVSEADRQIIRQIARRLDLAPDNQAGVDHDIRIALAGGLAGAPGIVAIIGTGSSCYGRTAQGRDCRVGGWGHLLDDGGSGYYLGLQAMIAAVRAVDGRGPSTSLLPGLLQALGIESFDLIMHRLYLQGLSRMEIAALAPLVLDIATQGDPVALDILRQAVKEITLLVEVAAHRLGFSAEDLKVTFSGGIVRSSALYRGVLYAEIGQRLPGVTIVEPILPPVYGATLLALQILGRAIDREIMANLVNATGSGA